MEPQELRIGNLISHDGKIIKVENIGDFFVNMAFSKWSGDRDGEISIDEILPIPLTEEWLLRAGFKKKFNVGCGNNDQDSHYWGGKRIDLTIDLELSSSNHNYDSASVDGSQHLKFVHQLQNLYFALTGEELNFNL